jgi:hypothetical protein
MSKKREMQRLIRAYKDETHERELDMRKVALWAAGKGWPLPTPPNPLDLLARQFSDAAREVIEYDKKTGRPYRVYHALKQKHGETQLHFFIDIEEATRSQMLVSLVNRREQMISEGVMLTYDQDHWNDNHLDQEPIQLTMDLAFDIEWRKNTPDDEEKPGG